MFVSVCQIYLTRTKRPGKNSTWIKDLSYEHQKDLSKVVNKMQVIPLGPKRVKLSENNNYKSNWQDIQHKVNNQQEDTKINDKRAETLKVEKKNRIEIRK